MQLKLRFRRWSLCVRQGQGEARAKPTCYLPGGRYKFATRDLSGEAVIDQLVISPAHNFQVARRLDQPGDLWLRDGRRRAVETFARTGSMRGIVSGPLHSSTPLRMPSTELRGAIATPRFVALFCHIDGLQEINVGESVILAAETTDAAEDQVARLRPPPGVNCVKVERDGQVVLRRRYRDIAGAQFPPAYGPTSYRSASEQMYFLAMPAAHIVAFQDECRAAMLRRVAVTRRYQVPPSTSR